MITVLGKNGNKNVFRKKHIICAYTHSRPVVIEGHKIEYLWFVTIVTTRREISIPVENKEDANSMLGIFAGKGASR